MGEPVLDDVLQEQIQDLSAEGDGLVEEKKYSEAAAKYREAFDLLPEPRLEWKPVIWLLLGLGDAYFLMRDYKGAMEVLDDALGCPEGSGIHFIHLRLGECAFELGDMTRAADELKLAYKGAGRDIFKDEEARYFEFLESRL